MKLSAPHILGTAGLGAVIALVRYGGLPDVAQTVILWVVAVLALLWKFAPDEDGDGVPDVLERVSPKFSAAIANAIRHGHVQWLKARLDAFASQLMAEMATGDPERDRRARSPWVVGLAAFALALLTACGGRLPVSAASESVAGTITGAASFECDAGGCERDGVGTAEITATADVCLDLFGGPVFCWPMTVDASAFVTDDRAEAVVCVEAAPFVKPACVSTAGE